MTSPDNTVPSLVLYDRWMKLRQALDSHYRIRAYPFAADRILNDARPRMTCDVPASLAFFRSWTTATIEAAIACCEDHRRVSPDALPALPPPELRHYNRRIDPDAARACLRTARTLALTPEQLLGIAVHDLLADAAVPGVPTAAEDRVGYVFATLLHLVQEIECHGNVPDPRTLPIRDPAADGEIPDPPPPWNYLPGRPPATPGRPVPAFRDYDHPEPAFVYSADVDDATLRRLDDWAETCDSLSFHYGWFGYPTIDQRILLHASTEEAAGLPASHCVNRWTDDQLATAQAACDRYVRHHPSDPPPFPPRQPRPYDTDASPADIASFVRACETLSLVPEDVLVLSLHHLCAADAPSIPTALRTLGLVLLDIETHGNVRNPVAAAAPPVVH